MRRFTIEFEYNRVSGQVFGVPFHVCLETNEHFILRQLVF